MEYLVNLSEIPSDWMSVKDPNVGNDHMVIPEVYKCLART